jgi:hypothetical protein
VWTRARGAADAAAHLLEGGIPGHVKAPRGGVERVLAFSVTDGDISAIELIAASDRLRLLDLRLLSDEAGSGRDPVAPN